MDLDDVPWKLEADAMPRYKLISCNVFQRELCAALARQAGLVDPEFMALGLHERPELLRTALQERIDAVSAASDAAAGETSSWGGAAEKKYDAILLGYGLCGNGLAGLQARSIPLVLPRAHDCCTLLLGSRAAFLEHFGDSLSASWSSAGYIERGTTYFRSSDMGKTVGYGIEYDELVEKYGEENAAFVWETMHPVIEEAQLRFIETEETAGLGYAELMRKRAAEEGKEFVLYKGSSRLLAALIAGGWEAEEFLVVPPGKKIEPSYDHDRIFEAR
jgi:hypothetical protein